MLNELPPSGPAEPTGLEIKPAHPSGLEKIIDFGQVPPAYRTVDPKGKIVRWYASYLASLSQAVRETILPKLLPRIGQTARAHLEHAGKDLKEMTAGEVFSKLIEEANAKGNLEAEIALEHALQNGHLIPDEGIQQGIRALQAKDSTISPQEAFRLLPFKTTDPRLFEDLGDSEHLLVTIEYYETRIADDEAASQPLKERIATAVPLEDLPGKTAEAKFHSVRRKIGIVEKQDATVWQQPGITTGDKGETYSVELKPNGLQQKDFDVIVIEAATIKFVDSLKHLRRENPDLTVAQAAQNIIEEQEKELQKARQATLPHVEFDPDLERQARDLRFFRFFSQNLNIVAYLPETPLQKLVTLEEARQDDQGRPWEEPKKDRLLTFIQAIREMGELRTIEQPTVEDVFGRPLPAIETRPLRPARREPIILYEDRKSGLKRLKGWLPDDYEEIERFPDALVLHLAHEVFPKYVVEHAKRVYEVASCFLAVDDKEPRTEVPFRSAVRRLLELIGGEFAREIERLSSQNKAELLDTAGRALTTKGIDLEKVLSEMKEEQS